MGCTPLKLCVAPRTLEPHHTIDECQVDGAEERRVGGLIVPKDDVNGILGGFIIEDALCSAIHGSKGALVVGAEVEGELRRKLQWYGG